MGRTEDEGQKTEDDRKATMTFTVTYRGRDGALADEAVEAANRAECVAECKRRGIAPTSIREGRSGKSAASPNGRAPSPSAPLIGKVAILAAVVLVVAGVAWWWFGRHGGDGAANQLGKETPSQPTNAVVKFDSKASHPPKASQTPSPKAVQPPQSPTPPDPTEPTAPMYMGRRVVGLSATTNADGTVVERIRTDDGKLHSKVYSVAEPVLTTRTDQLLAMAVEGDGNGPPMPAATKADEQQFLESLKKPIEILETDTPDVRALKEKVIQARADMVELLAQGRGFSEVLAEHQKLQAENAAVRRDVAKELRSLMDSGDTAAALEYRKRMNVALEQMGIAPLTTAITEEERAERAERRRASRKERLGK